ncbi:MAG: hypothetical protein AABY73_08010 [Pseudomonadota bacterium]
MRLQLPTKNKRILVALAVSLAFHLTLFFFKFSTPHEVLESNPSRVPSQLDVRLSPPDRAAPPPPLPPQASATQPAAKARRQPTQMQPAPMVAEAEKTWTTVEKDEMNRFLNELGTQSKPPSGTELARRALAMAKTLGRQDEKNDEMAEITQRLRAANIEPLSLELYFEALFRKLNRSATMVQRNAYKAGSQVAEVRVTLNPNGSVKSFTILHSADQQAEIAYIKSVVERAAPFPVFPADIRSATDKLILQICIQPSRFGEGTGAQFTRMSRGQSCRGDG